MSTFKGHTVHFVSWPSTFIHNRPYWFKWSILDGPFTYAHFKYHKLWTMTVHFDSWLSVFLHDRPLSSVVNPSGSYDRSLLDGRFTYAHLRTVHFEQWRPTLSHGRPFFFMTIHFHPWPSIVSNGRSILDGLFTYVHFKDSPLSFLGPSILHTFFC